MPPPQSLPQALSPPARSKLLADRPQEGCIATVMLAHGLIIEQLIELVRAGLATATAERVVVGSRRFEVATVRITDAGRHALGRARR